MKTNKMMFFMTMIMGSILSISSTSWFSMWMGLEINLLSIIPLMSTKSNISSEASMKYLIVQAMTSMALLFSIMVLMLSEEFIPPMNSTMVAVLHMALLMKLGAAPLHFWFPEIMKGLTWMNALIMMTWQKVAPSALIMMLPMNEKIISAAIICSLIISTIMGISQTDLRLMMTYSSINHLAWILSALMTTFSIWLTYMIIYSMINFALVSLFNSWKSASINQLTMSMNMEKTLKFSILINFLSLGGLPPMIGFFPKWLTINWMSLNNMNSLAIILIVLTLIMLFVYTRTILSSMTISSQQSKILKSHKMSWKNLIINSISILSLPASTILFNLS